MEMAVCVGASRRTSYEVIFESLYTTQSKQTMVYVCRNCNSPEDRHCYWVKSILRAHCNNKLYYVYKNLDTYLQPKAKDQSGLLVRSDAITTFEF